MSRGSLVAAAAATALAFFVRIGNVASLRASPFFELLVGDSVRYDAWARELASGAWLGTEVFYQAPLYPYWLGMVYVSIGDDLLLVRILQATLGALSCGFLALAVTRFFRSSLVGFVAGGLLAVYAPVVFHDALIQKSVLDTFLLCLLLFTVSANLDRSRLWLHGATGLTLGMMILTRENAAVIGMAILAWILAGGAGRFGTRFGRAFAFALGVLLVLLPVALRNLAVGGEFHLTSSQFGHNLYLGNNPDANGTYQPLLFGRGDSEWRDARKIAEHALERPLDPSEVSEFWTAQVVEYVRSEPLDWLELLGRKFLLSWNATELVDTEDQYTHASFSPVLRFSGALLHFGVLVPLALFGILVTLAQKQRVWILYAMIAAYSSTLLVFFVLARYRLPLVPMLIPFAAAGLVEGPRWLRDRIRESPLTAVGSIALVALVAVLGNAAPVDRSGMRAASYYNLGVALRETGRPDASVQKFREALRILPGYTEVEVALGNVLAQQEQLEEALELFDRAVKREPEVASIRADHGLALSKAGDFEGALEAFERAVELDPTLEGAFYFQSLLQLRFDRREAARASMEEAIRLDAGARVKLRHAAWLYAGAPEKPGPRDADRALQMARWAVQMGGGDDALSLSTLSAALATAGQFERAVRAAEEALRLAGESGNPELVTSMQFRLNRLSAGRRIQSYAGDLEPTSKDSTRSRP